MEPQEFVDNDPLDRMRVQRYARQLRKECWPDTERLTSHPAMKHVVEQLYDACGSIAANIAEGYGKSSGKDRARSFEYALGSARETAEWYDAAEPVLGAELVAERKKILGHIRRMLVAIIPEERKRTIKPSERPK